jgi:hypothetical protein
MKFKPFKLAQDDLIDEWCVYLEHPVNKDDFVVAYRAKEQADCEPVRFALNTLIQAHWDLKSAILRQTFMNETSDIEP